MDNLISSSNDDLKALDYPYAVTLVLTLQISNCEVGCVFIGPGTGVNIIFRRTLQRMDIFEYEVVPCDVVLVRYDGHRFMAAGRILLIVSTLSYNFLIGFMVLNTLTPYITLDSRA